MKKKIGKTGTAERPLSDLGKASYMSYWTEIILKILKDTRNKSVSIKVKLFYKSLGNCESNWNRAHRYSILFRNYRSITLHYKW